VQTPFNTQNMAAYIASNFNQKSQETIEDEEAHL